MKKLVSLLVAAVFAVSSGAALAMSHAGAKPMDGWLLEDHAEGARHRRHRPSRVRALGAAPIASRQWKTRCAAWRRNYE